MIAVVAAALNPIVIIFLMSTMLACGLGLTVRQIFAPFRNVRLAIAAAVLNFLVVPFIAIAASRLLGLEESLRYGLVLIAMTAAAEASPKLTGSAKGNMGLSVGLLALSLGVAVVYLPMMLSVLLPDAHVDRTKLLVKLCLTLALPIILGLFVKARWGTLADRLGHYVHKISSVSMLLLVVLLVILYYNDFLHLLGSGSIGSILIFIVVSFIAGYLFGWPERGTRVAMAFAAAARNNGLGLMVASGTFADRPQVLVMVVLTAVLTLIVLLPLSIILGRRASPRESAVAQENLR
jgi:bile acid:Na+ symporter, BASS family